MERVPGLLLGQARNSGHEHVARCHLVRRSPRALHGHDRRGSRGALEAAGGAARAAARAVAAVRQHQLPVKTDAAALRISGRG